MKEALNNYKAPQSKNRIPVSALAYMQFSDPEKDNSVIVTTTRGEVEKARMSRNSGAMRPIDVPLKDATNRTTDKMLSFHFRSNQLMLSFIGDLGTQEEPVTNPVKNGLVKMLDTNYTGMLEFGYLEYIIRTIDVPRGPSIWPQIKARLPWTKKAV